jgi:hypothetical protein
MLDKVKRFKDPDLAAELQWRWALSKERLRSGRLLMIRRTQFPGRKNTGPARVLALCACGNTKICQLGDLRRQRIISCSANCRHRLDIRHPHRKDQRTLSRKTKKLIRLGPPKWDPELKRGVFADGYSPAKKG